MELKIGAMLDIDPRASAWHLTIEQLIHSFTGERERTWWPGAKNQHQNNPLRNLN